MSKGVRIKHLMKLKDKEMMLDATDIVRTVAGKQKGIKKTIGRLLNKVMYKYYKWI